MTVTEGSLFSNVGVAFNPGFIDNSSGSVTFIADSLSGPGPGLSANGTLAQIVFDAAGTGDTSIDLSNIILLDSNLNQINANASAATVEVTGTSATPEPATATLCTLAIAAFCFAKRRMCKK